MELRKGFYFSFDALLALLVMSASLVVVTQSSEITADPFTSNTITYRQSSLVGQDAMRLASREHFTALNDSFQEELVEKTVMTESDLNRTVLDGVSLLWAARNFTYAEEVVERYFDSKVPDEYDYRLQVNEAGTETVIYETDSIPSNPRSVSSVSRLVSGHRIDKPSEGFQARARATEVTKNQTKAFSVSSQGGARFGGRLYIEKKFNVSADRIWNASLYLTPHYGCNNANFEQIRINGDMFTNSEINWINQSKQCPADNGYDYGTGALGWIDVTDKVEPGENTMSIRFRNNEYNAHLHPGMRMKIKYRSDSLASGTFERERFYFDDVYAEEHANDGVGLFAMKSYRVPEGAEVKNVTFHLNATGVDREFDGEWYNCQVFRQGGSSWYYATDVRIYHNGTLVDSGYGPSDGVLETDYDLTPYTNTGTNLVSVYLNWQGDCGWGEDRMDINSDFRSDRATHIDVWYEERSGTLEFGRIDVSRVEQFGETGNTITHEKEFNYSDLRSTNVFPTQLTGSTIDAYAWPEGGAKTNVFSSPASRAVPSSIYIDPSHYDTDRANFIQLDDTNPDNIFLPQSSFQYTLSVPSQVGYGDLFENQTASVEDAQDRLEDILGPFVDATGIESDHVSTGDQPYLWGPASVKLVVWRR